MSATGTALAIAQWEQSVLKATIDLGVDEKISRPLCPGKGYTEVRQDTDQFWSAVKQAASDHGVIITEEST